MLQLFRFFILCFGFSLAWFLFMCGVAIIKGKGTVRYFPHALTFGILTAIAVKLILYSIGV